MAGKDKVPKFEERVSEWLASANGQTMLREAHIKAEKASEDFKEASRVNPESLHKPCSC
jgi:hypothetical protein